jgi:hypothetical protein
MIMVPLWCLSTTFPFMGMISSPLVRTMASPSMGNRGLIIGFSWSSSSSLPSSSMAKHLLGSSHLDSHQYTHKKHGFKPSFTEKPTNPHVLCEFAMVDMVLSCVNFVVL